MLHDNIRALAQAGRARLAQGLASMGFNRRLALAQAGAAWWAEVLASTKVNVFDAGHKTPESIARFVPFQQALVAEIERALGSGAFTTIRVDYDPDELLKRAAASVGFKPYEKEHYPYKTQMEIDVRAGTIKVKIGLGEPMRQIYPAT